MKYEKESSLCWRNCIWILWFCLSILEKTESADNRVESLASVLREVTGQLERFNSLYISKFERELSSTSSRISSMEATLRSVADRAHAWDNIQNHMAVWTDQTRTMERKLDILNRCHEKQAAWESKLSAVDDLNHKLTALDNKINAMTRLEFKVEKVSERVEEIDSKINYLKERASDVPYGEQPGGLAHLAKRGLVSYLSTMDTKLDNITKKMDKLHHNHHNSNNHQPPRIFGARTRGSISLSEARIPEKKEKAKEITECFMSSQDSQMMEDVSAKVDLLFDRLTDPDYDYNTFVGNIKRQAPSSEAPSSASLHSSDFDSTSEHVFAKFWKSLFSPFKKMNRKFKTFEAQLNDIQRTCNGSAYATGDANPTTSKTTFGKLLDERLSAIDDVLREEMAETRVAVSDQSAHLEKITHMMSNSVHMNEKLKADVIQQFEANRVVLQSRFHEIWNLVRQNCAKESGPSYTTRATIPKFPSLTEAMPTTTSLPSTRVAALLPTFPANGPTLKSNRPSYTRAVNYAARCLPKDSPLWRMPNMAPSIEVCPTGTEEHRRFDYMVHYSPGSASKSATSKRTYRKSKNSIVRTYGRKKLAKRDLRSNGVEDLSSISNDSDFRSFPWADCSELLDEGYDESKVYLLGNVRDYNNADRDYYTRYCDHDTGGGGWTVIQRRGIFGSPYLNFTRHWEDYKNGFGRLEREFWWGNDFIHRLSKERPLTIRFELWDFNDNYAFAEYSNFKLESEENKYKLSVSGYRGNASDSFSAHNGFYFSTYDRDNDEAPECCPCAPAYGGGWWFYSCFESNLNGVYHESPNDNDYYRGLIWELWLGDYSLKATEIKVRPSSLSDSIFPTPFPDFNPTDNINPELSLP